MGYLMVQGTASGAGKSLLVAALCRLFADTGFRVAPFKAQNMSLNSCATPDGREIARSQWLQAYAARTAPRPEMNPILLKPKADGETQIVLRGRPWRDVPARRYFREDKAPLRREALACLRRLGEEYDLVVLEGAGSPAEINLRGHDLANMVMARAVDAPVVLVTDIDRGGSFASLVGTLSLLDPEDRRRIRGFVFNKFRGDVSILAPGLRELEARTGVPVLGVVPFLEDLRLPSEDSLRSWTPRPREGDAVTVAVAKLPRMSNFTDFEPLEWEEDVEVRYTLDPHDLATADAAILPGTKNTSLDLLALRERGLDRTLRERVWRGGPLLGVCGGFQMMGTVLEDPHRLESEAGTVPGLGLVDARTRFPTYAKTTEPVALTVATTPWLKGLEGHRLGGFEIRMGEVEVGDEPPLFRDLDRRGVSRGPEGVARGFVMGTSCHGLLEDDGFRRAWVDGLRRRKGWSPGPPSARCLDREIDRLARAVEAALSVEDLVELAGGTLPG